MLFMKKAVKKAQPLVKTVKIHLDKAKFEIIRKLQPINPQNSEHTIVVAKACIRKPHSSIN